MKCSRNKLFQEEIAIDNLETDTAQFLTQLRIVVNGHNSVGEEIEARIKLEKESI